LSAIDINQIMQAGAAIGGMYLMYLLANKMIDKITPVLEENTRAINELTKYIQQAIKVK